MKSDHIVLGILADVDAGKTTLSENILYTCGSIRKIGRVDHGDTCLDTDVMERERGITIFSKQAEFEYKEKSFTLLDTPGHADFSAETERVLSVLDYAVLVISGPEGVRSHVHTIWKLLKTYQIPVFVFINKMDQNNPNRDYLLRELNSQLGNGFISSDNLFSEDTAMLDDKLTEKYLNNEEISVDNICELIKNRKLYPCFFGSALKQIGIEDLLKGLWEYTAFNDYPDNFGAKVFKVTREKGERLCHVKVTGGILKVKDLIDEEKIEQIRLYSGDTFKPLQEARSGMVVSVLGLNKSFSGQGLGIETNNEMPVLVPLFSMTVKPTYDVSNAELYETLKKLEEEIPEISVDPFSGKQDVRIKLMGSVQTQVISRIMEERFQMPVRFENNRIVYRETVKSVSEGVGHFEPLRHYAEVHLRLEPGTVGSGMVFDTELSEDILPGNYQRLILSQLEHRWHKGILTGSMLTDVHVTLVAGKHHVKHTVGGDFREAGCRAIRHGLMKNQCKVLEPWYSFEMILPQEYAGRAMSDITCKLYGNFEGPETRENFVVLTGKAPVSTLQNYQAELTAYTKGYGKMTMQYLGYFDCHNEEEVILEENYDAQADLRNPCGSVFCEHGAGQYVNWDEVENWMHIPLVTENKKEFTSSVIQNKQVSFDKTKHNGNPDYLGAGYAMDKELETIFRASLGRNKKEEENIGRRQRSEKTLNKPEHVFVPEPKKNFLLVDGYNIIHAWKELKELALNDLNSARTALLDILSNYQSFRGMILIVVFDAYKVPGSKGNIEMYHNVHVVYTKEAETADAYIEKTVHEIGKKHNVTVATSDGLEQIIVFGEGAIRQSAMDLHKEVIACKMDIEDICYKNRSRLENRIPVPVEEKLGENHSRV